jgi:C1A family cysteine protease
MTNSKDSLSDIKIALSEAGDPWEAGYTSLTSLTDQERLNYLGFVPPEGEATLDEIEAQILTNQSSILIAHDENIGIPNAYDLRNVSGKNYITPVKNQGGCGSCVAFGVIATVEGQLRKQRNNHNLNVDLSEAHLYFCHARDRGRNCSNGWWPQQALDDFKSKGVVDEACYPYDLSKKECNNLCSNHASRVTTITGYKTVTNKPQDIKKHISTKGPVSACMIVYGDFYSYRSGVYKHVSGSKSGGHCVSIVGYNDAGKYWICKNSWGTSWGDSGFFKIAYGECGIETWLNHTVDAIANTGWRNGVRIRGLWAHENGRNAWVYVTGLGWRRVSHTNDNIFFDILAQLIAAKAANRPVNLYEENSVIKEVYVF